MFVQVIQGRAKDAAGLRKQVDQWEQELKPGVEGYLGSTGGVTDDGTFIMAARFESEGVARRNSDRPEQGRWWEETSKYLEPDVQFYDCTDVDTFMGGGSDDAGFVQVIQAYAKDKQKIKAGLKAMDDRLPNDRSDVIGGFLAWGPDDGFSQFVYFTSEKEARAGESKEPSEESRKNMEDWMSALDRVKYIDLRDPWLRSA